MSILHVGTVANVIARERKSPFVRLFTKTPPGVLCPHFYELILSNGCPYNCAYCYLKLTFRGKKNPVVFTNSWKDVKAEIDKYDSGVFSTGELADSLAIIPPLLEETVEYFRKQERKHLLLTTKSCNVSFFGEIEPTPQVIISFSVNAPEVALKYEKLAPSPFERLRAASKLLEMGWRVRVRLDPIVIENNEGIELYRQICREISFIGPERVTAGMLRQYPGLYRFTSEAPRKGLSKATDGRMRYPVFLRVKVYQMIAGWLNFAPALCKETDEVWELLGWQFQGCNCTL